MKQDENLEQIYRSYLDSLEKEANQYNHKNETEELADENVEEPYTDFIKRRHGSKTTRFDIEHDNLHKMYEEYKKKNMIKSYKLALLLSYQKANNDSDVCKKLCNMGYLIDSTKFRKYYSWNEIICKGNKRTPPDLLLINISKLFGIPAWYLIEDTVKPNIENDPNFYEDNTVSLSFFSEMDPDEICSFYEANYYKKQIIKKLKGFNNEEKYIIEESLTSLFANEKYSYKDKSDKFKILNNEMSNMISELIKNFFENR